MTDAALLHTLADTALRGGLLAQLAVLGLLMGRDRPGTPLARVGVALAAGLCVQVISSAPLFEARVPLAAQVPCIAVATANSVLFWLFARALFDDEFRPRPTHAGVWAGVAALSALNCAWLARPDAGAPEQLLGATLRWLPLGFAAAALVAAWQHWRADLVERRRRLRGLIIGGGSLYTAAMLALRHQDPQGRLSDAAALWDTLALTALVGLISGRLLRLGAADLFPVAPGPAPGLLAPAVAAGCSDAPTDAAQTAPDPVDERLAADLQRLMSEARIYRSEDLSIGSLADRLRAPEYRLRRLINQRLGHRNFNAFINSHRLAEAQAALADPARRELPVLSIALEAGFQSIGPFNRAFKAATGRTPTEFRREKLADS
jgi:AraC-like DNA-binding protein